MRKLTSPVATYLQIYLVALLMVAGLLYWTYSFVQPAPPTHFRIATGKTTGAYFGFAANYARILKQQGIDVDIVPTEGSMDNLKRLRDESSDIDVAFIQSGVAKPTTNDTLRSIASVFYEPFWLLYQSTCTVQRLSDFKGLRIAASMPDSGTYALARQLFAANGVDPASLLTMENSEAVKQLATGEIDAACFVGNIQSGYIDSLTHQKKYKLFDCPRAPAYVSRYPFLSVLTLPEGIIDLAENIPPQDITLLSACATLVCREDFHPALIDLLLQATAKVHAKPHVFSREKEFPTAKYVDFPLSPDAERYFTYGPPLLQRLLPFWLATLVDRLKVMILPMLVLLIPLFKIIPPMLKWRINRKINRWYKSIQSIDILLNESLPPDQLDGLIRRLEDIEQKVTGIAVPAGYADKLYDLRVHIDLVRTKMSTRGSLRTKDATA